MRAHSLTHTHAHAHAHVHEHTLVASVALPLRRHIEFVPGAGTTTPNARCLQPATATACCLLPDVYCLLHDSCCLVPGPLSLEAPLALFLFACLFSAG